MNELDDYGGQFDPQRKIDDFSKEFLLKLLRQWAYAYLRMAEVWVGVVKQRVNAGEDVECELEAWRKIAETTLPRIAKVMNIEPKTVVDALKIWQLIPDGMGTGLYDSVFEVKNENHVIWTLERCRSLEFLEKIGDTERLVACCQVIDPAMLQYYLEALLPNARIEPLKLPCGPRKDPTETPACRWEIKLES